MDEDIKAREMFKRFMKGQPPIEIKYLLYSIALGLFIAVILSLIFLISPVEASCSRDINLLTPETRSVYNEFSRRAKEAGISFILTCGYRTQEEQDELYVKGRTTSGKKVTWTRRSKHTKRIAFDIAVFKYGRISWEPRDYLELGEIAKSLGLTWGGDWKVRDYCHFELSGR